MYKPILLIFFAALIGCSTPASSLRHVEIGMTKNQVPARGEPQVSVDDQCLWPTIEVLEYRLAMSSDDSAGQIIGKSVFTAVTLGIGATSFRSKTNDYWLYFYDGTLARWGAAGN